MMMSVEDGPYQYINPEVLATEVPKQFFIDLKEWINDGCFPDDEEFVANLGICANLATYMSSREAEQNRDYWYDYISKLFDGRAYPFGKDGYRVHRYIGSSDIISRRLQFIDYNIAHLPE